MAILNSIFTLLFGQKPLPKKAKFKTTKYQEPRTILWTIQRKRQDIALALEVQHECY